MLNAVLVKEIKWLEMGWNGVVSPNLSELVRAVRTVDELAKVYPKMLFQSQDYDTTTPPVHELFITKSVNDKYGHRFQNPPLLPFGNDKPHNTMQPSKAVYAWIRTA